ncbi:DUF255 domain-containing protein [Flammeovirga yaeyamensis]|uniref:DUF255 domain-containing protein n=1 Tax=Flammeovirga yaeyamensis TaxID=367791 RepID=A0AAX1MY63_9BACT|nr:DUF255 domain-containing protein [Flammeovirga yaeyamensis]MBB3696317.1 thioredoxin-related protein [Flammeovirga yaeyamensis]NMF34996.1 DUF255 domain-containing protein [Flammeovirga yaeyamensis]QWG00177.1 DUF255 domain-containing protein [Flammeovirga yaeyamensis]
MKKLYLFLLLVFITKSAFCQQTIQWLTFEEALQKNKLEQKQFFIDVYTNWCTWCKKMDRTTFKNEEIVSYINANFYAVKINAEDHSKLMFQGEEFTYESLSHTLLGGNMGFPTYVFLWVRKDEQLQANPYPIQGYIKKQKLHLMLSFMNEAAYEGVEFKEFREGYLSPY